MCESFVLAYIALYRVGGESTNTSVLTDQKLADSGSGFAIRRPPTAKKLNTLGLLG